ncbi:MAG: prolyl oligopeptidase family serine peptidase [Pseudolabrys sp.]
MALWQGVHEAAVASKQTGSFGSWSSPITADAVAAGALSLLEPRIDGDDIYWIEARPLEKGRNVVVVRAPDDTVTDITPPAFNARTQVYSYGGGAYAVKNQVVYFVNFSDNQIYRQAANGAPTKITSNPSCVFADICVDATRNRLVAIREERPNDDVVNAIHTLVAIDIATGRETTLDSSYDFYSSPTLSPDGSKLAWLSWRHPNMPWTSTYLNAANIDKAGALVGKQIVQGGGAESIFQPQWSPDGQLYFISDRTEFWNLYRWNTSGVEHILPRDAEFGVPQWNLALSTYAFLSCDAMLYSFVQNSMWRLGRLDIPTLTAQDYPTEFSSLSYVCASATKAVVRYATTSSPRAIGTVDLKTGAVTPIKFAVAPDTFQAVQNYFSTPKPIEFPTSGGDIAHAFYYPPCNPDWQAPSSEKPPLLVKSHGGPTTATDSALSLSVQFWTSRGFGVLDVNYRGSTGYGRKYREKLYGQWGVVDVVDCISGAKFLADRGDVDGSKLAVTGGSAGGFTTLCGLTFHTEFVVGASYYGISDLVAIATQTHKFELHYTDWLIEPFKPGSALYHDRSPINFVNRLFAPVIFLHGKDDPIVPINQAEKMHSALKARNISTCLLVFEGEKHGFRQSAHLRQALEAELLFYSMNLTRAPLTS